ncbi:MAG: hypothetical protein M3Y08_16055 [Fibrobacterota bacterium]|nr:hypothetical protein [Fibrobacterota bacterium]
MGIVLVELGLGIIIRQAVEVREQVHFDVRDLVLILAAPQQVIDQHLGVDFFLDVQGRGMHHQIGPVLLVLAAPDQLRVQILVAALVGHANGGLGVLAHHALVFCGGDVFAGGFVVLEGLDGFFTGCFSLGHSVSLPLDSGPFPNPDRLSGLLLGLFVFPCRRNAIEKAVFEKI